MARSPFRIILENTIGFVIFLIILAVLNWVEGTPDNSVFSQVVRFLNSSIILFLVLYLTGLLSELFWAFGLPANLAAPLFSAVHSIFIVAFFFRVFGLVSGITGWAIALPEALVQLIVFILVFLLGYVLLALRGGRPRDEWAEERKEIRRERRARKEKVEWEDVGDEFRMALYQMAKAMEEAFRPKKQKRKK